MSFFFNDKRIHVYIYIDYNKKLHIFKLVLTLLVMFVITCVKPPCGVSRVH